MTEAEARARISLLCDAGADPPLAPPDLDALVSMAKRVDNDGIWPTEDNWTQTYDVNYAAAQGWLLRAGRLARAYLFMSGGKMLSRNQYYEHCMQMYKKYAGKAQPAALRLGPRRDWVTGVRDVPLLNQNL